jgi:DNA modification methylase|tara:strand:- start:267 stop:1178 length:912 start_codon:yes stop_codon:yes gene_type:complete
MTLINGDCTLVADQITDNSIDFLLTDPPYNISDDGAKPEWIDPKTGENKNTIHSQKFDENFDTNWDRVTHDEFLKQMESWSKVWYDKLRKGGAFAVFISDKYISHLWKIMEATGFEPKRIFTWKKPAAVPFNRKVNPVSGCEYILWGIKPGGPRTFNSSAVQGTMIERYARADKISSILYKMIKDNVDKNIDVVFADALKESKKMLQNQKRDADVVHCVIPNTITYSGGLGKDKIHPTQKPVEVLRYFIELCTNENDTVLDTFAGSGSTGIACKETNRKYVLIERDTKMFSLMKKKFDGDLFD